jgi:hypothetical protein
MPLSNVSEPIHQEDFFVWIKNLDYHMKKRTIPSRLLNSFGNVLALQIFQESPLVFKASVTINKTRKRLEAATAELRGRFFWNEILL